MNPSPWRSPVPSARPPAPPTLQAVLQARFDRTFQDQDGRFGGYDWTPKEMDLIGRAQQEVQRTIQAAKSAAWKSGAEGLAATDSATQAFDAALAVFVRRTTPMDNLMDEATANSGDVGLWVAAVKELAERSPTGQPEVVTVAACSRLGGLDLVFRVLGEPREAEFALDELPALLEMGAACKGNGQGGERDGNADLESLLMGVLDAWATGGFGAGCSVVGFTAEGAGTAGAGSGSADSSAFALARDGSHREER